MKESKVLRDQSNHCAADGAVLYLSPQHEFSIAPQTWLIVILIL
jgi:hypothetical protein